MFRHAWGRAKYHGRRALGHAMTAAGHVDRALGTAAKYVSHLAPVVLPIARHAGYGEIADQIHHGATTVFKAREHGAAVGNAIREARSK